MSPRTRRPRWSVLIVCALAGCTDETPQQILGTLERDRLELIAESSERIVEIAVREGDQVAAGALLLRQEPGLAEPRLAASRASQVEAERRLADLVAGPRKREIDEARAALAGADSAWRTDASEYERVAELVERKLLSASDLDRARARRDASRSSRDAAQARLDVLREGARSEQVAAARAAVDRAGAALAEVETSAGRYAVHAPRAGRIEALPYELGERPPTGRPVVVMLADGAPYARVYVPEPLRTQFVPGTAVEVSLDGESERYAATVRYVSAEAAFTPYYALTQKDRSRLAYLAEVTLDEPAAERLPTGVPVQVRVRSEPR